MSALLPAALAALFACWCGTLRGGAGAVEAATGQAALLLVAALGAREASDPWRLGSRLGSLPWAAWAAVVGSWALSPLPRAGRVAVLLVPAFVLLPSAVARCLGDARRRALAVASLVLLADAVAIWGLWDLARDAARAARPLGHHQLLAAWLVAFFPLALLLLGRERPWRWFGLVSAVAIGGSVVATRSLLGLLALAIGAALSAVASRRAWRLVLGLALLAGAWAVPRLEQVIRGTDPSALARWDYVRAGWRGITERPVLGWGPGTTPWTVARFLDPAPGRRPAGELVGDLHSLPPQLVYELGAVGGLLLLAAGSAFVWVRRARRLRAVDRRLSRAALVGLAALGLVALGNGAIAVTALPVAAAVLAGLALAAESGEPLESTVRGAGWTSWTSWSSSSSWSRWVTAAGLLGIAAGLVPLAAAARAYERAGLASDPAMARAALDRAIQLDPDFPLYRARRAWLDGAAGAAAARQAAFDAGSVAPLWLAAGVAAREIGEPWAVEALLRACELDPMGPIAPLQLAMALPEDPRAPGWAARALASEPRLAAALFWEKQPQLFEAALARLEEEPRLDLGLRAELVSRGRAVARGEGGLAELGLVYDGRGATAGSLYLFRRSPWHQQLGGVAVRKGQIGRLRLPSASELATSAPSFYSRDGCRR